MIIRRYEHAESRSDGVIELKRGPGRKRTERVIPGWALFFLFPLVLTFCLSLLIFFTFALLLFPFVFPPWLYLSGICLSRALVENTMPFTLQLPPSAIRARLVAARQNISHFRRRGGEEELLVVHSSWPWRISEHFSPCNLSFMWAE